MLGVLAVLASLGAWIAEHTFLARWINKSPGQQAVNAQRKMAQDQVDAPDQAQAVKILEDGDA